MHSPDVVLVQGHPAVGKTSLLSLLYHHIDSLSDPHLRLFQFFSWNKESVERAGGWRKYIYEMTDQDLDLNATVLQPYLILLDEAQVSYRDEDFWAEYVKVVAQDQRG